MADKLDPRILDGGPDTPTRATRTLSAVPNYTPGVGKQVAIPTADSDGDDLDAMARERERQAMLARWQRLDRR